MQGSTLIQHSLYTASEKQAFPNKATQDSPLILPGRFSPAQQRALCPLFLASKVKAALWFTANCHINVDMGLLFLIRGSITKVYVCYDPHTSIYIYLKKEDRLTFLCWSFLSKPVPFATSLLTWEGIATALKFLYLDHWDPRFEPGGQLSEDFTKQLLVFQDLPHFHDSHDGRLCNQKGKTCA